LTNRQLDPQYGKFIVFKVSQKFVEENGKKSRIKIKQPIDYSPCRNATDQFLGFNETKKNNYGIPLLLCVKDLT
jgi:hypothetical protein